MPAQRSVVPRAAARSLWLAAVWTGIGAALVAAVVAIVSVAVLWLPAAGSEGSAGSVVRAGLITFVASLHGGVTVDGLDAAFLPLGLLIALALVCRRAGRALANAAADLGENDPARLATAALVQVASFTFATALCAAGSRLGTSSVSVPGAVIAAALVFAVTGGTSLARATPLGPKVASSVPVTVAAALRIAAAVVAVYLACGAVLAGASLVMHHHEAAQLSSRVGGGWSGVPVLLLGVLAAPNAAIAGASYLAGPGFAVGSATTAALDSSPTGRLPAFPVLAAVPSGPAPWAAWLLVVLTPLAAGAVAAMCAAHTDRAWRSLGAGVVVTALAGLVLAWQGGGRIGSAGLHAIGASPWQFGLVVGAGAGIAGALWLALAGAARVLRKRGRAVEPDGKLGSLVASISATVEAVADDIEHSKDDRLAG